MTLNRRTYLLFTVLLLTTLPGLAQYFTPLGGVVNEYAAVDLLIKGDPGKLDTIVVNDVTGFSINDTVMLYGVNGAKSTISSPQIPRNSGRYMIARIDTIIGNKVLLNVKIDWGLAMGVNSTLNMPIFQFGHEAIEQLQLIRVRSSRNAVVQAAGITAPAWDEVSGTGGVVALMINGSLRLEGDIQVDAKGFSGASGSDGAEYGGACSTSDPSAYDDLDYEENQLYSGYKGESIVLTDNVNVRGRGANIIGGGGGNGHFSGGGGGGNGSEGGDGGAEPCSLEEIGGTGGVAPSSDTYYRNYRTSDNLITGYGIERVFFGGGGGTGVWRTGFSTTDGGAGGGVIYIIADTIIGNGNSIRSDGEDVIATATGAGGGGGAGGVIVLQVNQYKGALSLSAVGGDGGSVSGATGSSYGGAGGGGVYWLSQDVQPAGVTISNDKGADGDGYEGSNGPKTVYNLDSPLRGFIFNPVPTEFTICSDQPSWTMEASTPRGGSGNYGYQWYDSTKTRASWESISGATSKDLDVPVLNDTIWYKRGVCDLSVADSDTSLSFRIVVHVHQAIENNLITAPDTVCAGFAPETFYTPEGTDPITGGYLLSFPDDSTMNYYWQHMPEGQGDFTNYTASSKDSTLTISDDPGLSLSTDYRRIAYSGACYDTSDFVHVRVLTPISGNLVTKNDTICIYETPNELLTSLGESIGDGEPGDYRFRWEQRLHGEAFWSTAVGTADLEGYQPPALDDTTWYRRLIYSGNGDACIDTSAALEMLVFPDITNNILPAGQDHQICQLDTAEALNASVPGGGDQVDYVYTWLMSSDQVDWEPAFGRLTGDNGVQSGFEPGIMTGSDMWYKRLVRSGGSELVCSDTTTDLIQVTVLDSITNNMISTADDRYCQLEQALSLDGAVTGGEARSRIYSWYRVDSESMPGDDELGVLEASGSDPNLPAPINPDDDQDRWYRRVVTTGPMGECLDTSNLIHLVVHTSISGNWIDDEQAICANDPGERILRDSIATGESGETSYYSWKQWDDGQDETGATLVADKIETTYGAIFDGSVEQYNFRRITEIGECIDSSGIMRVDVVQRPAATWADPLSSNACSLDTVTQGVIFDMSNPGISRPPTEEYPWVINVDLLGSTILSDSLYSTIDSVSGVVVFNSDVTEVERKYSMSRIAYDPEPLVEDAYMCTASSTGDELTIIVARTPVPQILAEDDPDNGMKFIEVCGNLAEIDVETDGAQDLSWSFQHPSGYVDGGISSTSDASGSSKLLYHMTLNDPDYYALLDESDPFRLSADESSIVTAFFEAKASNGCYSTDTVLLYFFEQPDPPNAGFDTTIFLMDTIRLDAEPPSAGFGWWSLGSSGSAMIDYEGDIYSPEALAMNLEMNAENEFIWTVANGREPGGVRTCVASEDFMVVTRTEVHSYDAFSPNDDDLYNRYFIMQGLPFAEGATEITFFNSLGSIVRKLSKNMDEAPGEQWMDGIEEGNVLGVLGPEEMVVWDGLSDNGQPVPSGIYYYVVTFSNLESDGAGSERLDKYEYSGTVELLREAR